MNLEFCHMPTTVLSSPLSIKELLASVRYGFIHEAVNDLIFPEAHTTPISSSPKVFAFDRKLSTDRVGKAMLEEAHRPATAYDLLHYSADRPNEPFLLPLIALGTVIEYVDDKRFKRAPYALVIQDFSYRRGANLVPTRGDWAAGCSFLGIPM